MIVRAVQIGCDTADQSPRRPPVIGRVNLKRDHSNGQVISPGVGLSRRGADS